MGVYLVLYNAGVEGSKDACYKRGGKCRPNIIAVAGLAAATLFSEGVLLIDEGIRGKWWWHLFRCFAITFCCLCFRIRRCLVIPSIVSISFFFVSELHTLV